MPLNKRLENDLEYMSSLSSASLQKTPSSSRIIMWLVTIAVFWFILWTSFAYIDEITRGEGKVIPSGQIQVIQNLEGGIIEAILVKEGSFVKKGDILLKIDNKKFVSSFEENKIKVNELKVKAIRLHSEATGKIFRVNKKLKKEAADVVRREYSLYKSSKRQFNSKIRILKQQLSQKKSELTSAKTKENDHFDLLT